jgi:hypothetical protein
MTAFAFQNVGRGLPGRDLEVLMQKPFAKAGMAH